MPSRDTRRHRRVDLFAQVQVSSGSEVHIMPAANISLGGIFICGDPFEYPDLAKGKTVELSVFAGEDLPVNDLLVRATVVRVVGPDTGPPGFGLEFTGPLPPEQGEAIAQLMRASQPT